MRNFMIRAFEALILAFSLVSALGVTLAAAAMVMGQATLGDMQGPLSMLPFGAAAPVPPELTAETILGETAEGATAASLEVWVSAAIVLIGGYVSIILVSGAALTLTGIYRRMTRLVQLIETAPAE